MVALKEIPKPQKDWPLRVLITLAAMSALGSFGYFFNRHLILAYTDAVSHMEIARRVVESSTNSHFGQLGTVWLPLQHVLMLPFVWNNTLYFTGVAGSIISMVSFLITVLFIYKTVTFLTGDRGAGFIAAAIFIGNLNVLYMQSTPMTEMPLLATEMGAGYYLIKFSSDPTEYRNLLRVGAYTLLASLTRYEGWVLAAVVVGVSYIVLLRSKKLFLQFAGDDSRGYIVGNLAILSFMAFVGVGGWLLWNGIIFHDFFNFMSGEYGKPSNWVHSHEVAQGSLQNSFLTYFYATMDIAGLPVLAASGIGMVYFLVKSRLSNLSLATLALFFPFPFFVEALYAGQRPLHVTEFGDTLYNARFALQMLLGIVVFAGFLTKGRIWIKILVVLLAAAGLGWSVWTNTVPTLNEAENYNGNSATVKQVETARWLGGHYDGGLILIESYGNELAQFYSGLDMDQFIYEGNHGGKKDFDAALENPSKNVKWIYTRDNPDDPDKVWKSLQADPSKLGGYRQVYSANNVKIFERT